MHSVMIKWYQGQGKPILYLVIKSTINALLANRLNGVFLFIRKINYEMVYA